MTVILIFCLLLLTAWPIANGSDTRSEYAKRLSEIQARSVNPQVPPLTARVDRGGRVPVYISFVVNRILSLSPKSETVYLSGTINLTWNDSRLAWTGAPTALVMKGKDVWLPLLSLQTSADFDLSSLAKEVRLHSSGQLSFEHTMRVDSSCQLDVYLFPRDVQHCVLTFRPSVIQEEILRPMAYSGKPKTIYAGEEWHLTDIVDYVSAIEVFDRQTQMKRKVDAYSVHLLLSRSDAFYSFTVLLPTLLLALITLVPYLLPPNLAPQKILIPITTFLSFNIYMTLLDKTLPHSGDVPVLGKVYAVLLSCCVITEFFQAVSIKFYSCNLKKVPSALAFLYLRILGRICLFPVCHGVRKTREEASSIESTGTVEKGPSMAPKKMWIMIGRINDRAGFIITLTTVVIALLYFLVLCYSVDNIPTNFPPPNGL